MNRSSRSWTLAGSAALVLLVAGCATNPTDPTGASEPTQDDVRDTTPTGPQRGVTTAGG